MQIVIPSQIEGTYPQFIVALENRYTYLFKKIDGVWTKNGGHLWQTGQPQTAQTQRVYLNPNTGEMRGQWVYAYRCFFPSAHKKAEPEMLSLEWAELMWEAALKSLELQEPEKQVTKEEVLAFQAWPESDQELALNTVGLAHLFRRFERHGGGYPGIRKTVEEFKHLLD
jgi:hypothetical protein